MGDLGKLPLDRDKPLKVGRTTGKVVWERFNIVVTLDKIYKQQGENLRQAYFRNPLTNIINVEPILSDWDLLMTCVDSCLDQKEKCLFDSCVHLFVMNNIVNLHNHKLIKSLNCPI